MTIVERPRCPNMYRQTDVIDWCEQSDKLCLLEEGCTCEEYERFLEEDKDG